MVKNGRTDYRLKGDPWRVNVHDFEDKRLGKVVPYGPAVPSTDQRIFSGFVTRPAMRRNPIVAPPRPAPAPCDLWPICHSNLKHNYPLNQGESRRREGAPVMDRREPRACDRTDDAFECVWRLSPHLMAKAWAGRHWADLDLGAAVLLGLAKTRTLSQVQEMTIPSNHSYCQGRAPEKPPRGRCFGAPEHGQFPD
jgi:hypothetical protein